MKKIILVFILILVCMSVFNIPYFVKNFEQKYDCIKYVVGENKPKPSIVKIKGTISKYLIDNNDVVRYTLQIDDVNYPISKENIAIYPYKFRNSTSEGIYAKDNLQYKETDEIERVINYRGGNYEFDIQYSYFDSDKLDFITEHNGFINISKDYSKICIGLFPNEGYMASEFPKGIIAIVSASSLNEAEYTIDEFWKLLMN